VIFSGPTTFEAVPFAVNVVITWAIVFALTRWAGWVAAFGSMIAGVLALALTVGMGLASNTFGGFPIPAFKGSPLSTSLTLWIDAMLWSFALAAIIRRLRARKALKRVRAT